MTPSDKYGRRDRAFTLVELVMVLAAIVVLAGIVVGTTRKVMDSAHESNTWALLRAMSAIATEYEVQTGRVIDHPEVEQTNYLKYTIVEFVDVAKQLPSVRKLMESLDSEFYSELTKAYIEEKNQLKNWKDLYEVQKRPGPPFPITGSDGGPPDEYKRPVMWVVDAWGNPLVYVSSNKHSDESGIRWLPEHPEPFFASSGPDGLWGSFKINIHDPSVKKTKRDRATRREDDLYSFELD